MSGKTKLYGLIGDPVSHSLSPFIMNRAFDECGLDGVYVVFKVNKGRLGEAVAGLRSLGLIGVNVTFPFKEAVLSFVDDHSAPVGLIRAVNTLKFAEGRAVGFNTDAPGLARAVEIFGGLSIPSRRVFIFGTGGAGRAAACGLLERGAGGVVFGSRDPSKAEALVRSFGKAFPKRSLGFAALGGGRGQSLREALAESDIVINATPVGMEGFNETPLVEDPSWFLPKHLCFDLVYHPRETRFLELASLAGARTLGGLVLLVSQAEETFRLWTGQSFSLREMLEEVEAFAGHRGSIQ